MTEPLYLAADHGGFHLKQALRHWLIGQGWEVEDLGAATLNPDDDYPLVARAAAQKVSADSRRRAILLCRSGQGVAIVANKFPGVRAALAWDAPSAASARSDDGANILCLPADRLSEAAARAIVTAWFTTPFKAEDRYERRLSEIRRIEKETMK